MASVEMHAPGVGRETERVCFVCMEPCDEESKCKCTDRYVHSVCLLKWLRTKTSNHCDVCLGEYLNVGLETQTSTRPSSSCWGVVLGGVWFVAMMVGGSLMLSMYLSPDRVSGSLMLALGILMVGMSIVGLVGCTMCGVKFRREGCRLLNTTSRRLVVMR